MGKFNLLINCRYLLFIISCFALLSCVENEDNNIENSNEVQPIISRKVPFSKTVDFEKIVTALEKSRVNLNKILFSNQKSVQLDSVTINLEEVLYLTYADTHTYTFTIERSNPDYYIENFVLHYNSDTQEYDEYVLQYELTGDEFLLIDQGNDHLVDPTVTSQILLLEVFTL